MRSSALECDEYAVGGGIGRRRGADRARRHGFRNEAAADAAEIIAIEDVGMRVFAERKDERLRAAGRGHVEGHRIGAPEVGIALIERVPVRGREKVLRLVVAGQVWRQTENRLTIGPGRRTKCIAGGNEQRAAVAADATRRPDAAAAAARGPGDDITRVIQANADDPAAIIPAIAEMTAIGHIEAAGEDGERAALALNACVETPAPRGERFGDIEGPARLR